jgi:uncharacterized membrane protein YoaK (UPF0700 family)
MIYGHQSISTYTPSNVLIWMALAFQAGLLNIGAFMACHRFVSHITGFATFFGVEVSKHDYPNALGMLLVPVLFLCGAMLSGQLVDIRLKLGKKPKYYLVFGILFFILIGIVISGFNGVFGKFGEPLRHTSDYALLSLLCLVCGMQNGMITTVSKAVVRTTHLTGITTDLGIGIVRVLNRRKLKGDTSEDARANLMRIGIIFFFGSGSVVGGLIFTHIGYQGFLLPSLIYGILFATMFYYQVVRPQPL